MKVSYFTLFIFFALTAPLASADVPTNSRPGCSFNTAVFEGELVATDLDDGFPTVLKTMEENLPQVQLSCEGVTARLEVSVPFPVKDEDGDLSPKLAGPFRSFLIYEGDRYRNDQSVLTTGSFRNRPISVGISVENRGNILPAADNYRYQVFLTVTVTEP